MNYSTEKSLKSAAPTAAQPICFCDQLRKQLADGDEGAVQADLEKSAFVQDLVWPAPRAVGAPDLTSTRATFAGAQCASPVQMSAVKKNIEISDRDMLPPSELYCKMRNSTRSSTS